MHSTLLFLDNLGGGELLLIMVFVLFFFGSKKIPDLARGLGRASREFKDAMSGVQREIEQSIHTPPAEPKKIPDASPKPENDDISEKNSQI
jgi:sec-independent protein translocase protein TatA